MNYRSFVRRSLVLLLTILPGLVFASSSARLSAQEPQGAVEPAAVQAIGTAFTYQGRLTDNGAPASGKYDFVFALYNAETGGAQIGNNVSKEDVVVKDGYFTTQLDFGNVFNGDPRYLEIGVRPGASTGIFTPLIPRRPISPNPYTIRADIASFLNYTGEYRWYQGDAPIQMIPSTNGFCFLTFVAGSFAGGGENVYVYIGGDGFWYLTGSSLQVGVEAKARCAGRV